MFDPLIPVANLYAGDGTTTSFQYTFEAGTGTLNPNLLTKVQVRYIPPGEVEFVEQVVDEDYTIDTTTKIVTFLAAPQAHATIPNNVRIERGTDLERDVDYQGGDPITENQLDRDGDRLTMVTQELAAELERALKLNDAGDAYDAGGFPIHNGAPGTDADDYVTLAQIAQFLGGIALTLSNDIEFFFLGDGDTSWFQLAMHKNVEASNLFVMRGDGVVQNSNQSEDPPAYRVLNPDDDDYPDEATDGDSVLMFPDVPLDGEKIVVRSLTGTVLVGALPDGSVTSDSIADGAVGLEQMQFEDGDDLRFMVIDPDGDPEIRTIDPDDVQGFDDRVRSSRLDQMTAPALDVSWASKRITDLAAGTDPAHAVNKAQLDAATGGAGGSRIYTGGFTQLAAHAAIVPVGMAPTVQAATVLKAAVVRLQVTGHQFDAIASYPTQWITVTLHFSGSSAGGTFNVIGQSSGDGTVTSYQGTLAITKSGTTISLQALIPGASTWSAPSIVLFS